MLNQGLFSIYIEKHNSRMLRYYIIQSCSFQEKLLNYIWLPQDIMDDVKGKFTDLTWNNIEMDIFVYTFP